MPGGHEVPGGHEASGGLPGDDGVVDRPARQAGADDDRAALRTLAGLRRRFLPEVVDGVDVLDRPLDETSGLLVGDPA